MIIAAGNRKIKVGRGPILLMTSVGVTAAMLALSGLGAVSTMLVIGAMYPLVWLASKPLSRFIARIAYSIRWKFEFAIAAISALFLVVSLVNYGAMESMHSGVHEIKEMMGAPGSPGNASPSERRTSFLQAMQDLEDKQHGFLFRVTPIMGSAGVLIAAALGAAMAWSVIVPVRRMGESMAKIGSGDFTRPVEVDNQDELGDLAHQINDMASELARLQVATLEQERSRALRERMTHVVMAEEEERRRISRELHDGLGPSLAAIGNRVRAARHTLSTDPEGSERQLDEIADSVKGHIQEIRGLIYDLRPLALDQLGLKGAVQQMVDRLGEDAGIEAAFTGSQDTAATPLTEVTVFRVAQECLTNVQDHSAASEVAVQLNVGADGVRLRVEDNGQGFDPTGVSPVGTDKGLGLFSMRERAEALGGTFSLQSSPGEGCVAVLSLPLVEVTVGASPGPTS